MAPKLVHKGKEVVPSEIVRAHGDIAAQALVDGRPGEGTSHGETIRAVPAVMPRRVTSRRPGPAYRGLQQKAGSLKKDERPALMWGFFACGPRVFGPVSNGRCIPLPGALGGFLEAPAQPPQEVPDARGAIGNATVAVNERRDPR
jgi:hypothetical protein